MGTSTKKDETTYNLDNEIKDMINKSDKDIDSKNYISNILTSRKDFEELISTNMNNYMSSIELLEDELNYWNDGAGKKILNYVRDRNFSGKGKPHDLEIILSEDVMLNIRDSPISIVFYADEDRIESSKDLIYQFSEVIFPETKTHEEIYIEANKRFRGSDEFTRAAFPELIENLIESGIGAPEIHIGVRKKILDILGTEIDRTEDYFRMQTAINDFEIYRSQSFDKQVQLQKETGESFDKQVQLQKETGEFLD